MPEGDQYHCESITAPKAPRKFFIFLDPETRNILTYPKILSICLFRSSKKYNGAEGAAKIFGYFSNVAIDKPEVFELTRTFWKSFQSVTRKSSGRAKMFGSCQNQITKILQHWLALNGAIKYSSVLKYWYLIPFYQKTFFSSSIYYFGT